jgi:endogenous inhibitor of DNA gyrase (YacG/DUF329 family)
MFNKQIKCPQCGRLTFYSPENKYRPFCSERCRLIDLGQWADGSYKLASEDALSESDLADLGEDDSDER